MPFDRPGQIAKTVALIVLLAVLAACARYSGPIKGDNKPHPGVDRARNMPIQGIDIARYQGIIDFNAARAGGTRFVYMKATEGGDYVDPMFYDNWNRAKAAGMAHGAYHFMTWCRTAAEQAAWFIEKVPVDPTALPPVLDLEWNHLSSCKNRPSKQDALEKIRVMVTAMEAHTGKVPIIYTDMTFHRDILEGESFDNPFWLRSTAAEPHMRYSSRGWTFWQWTQTGTMPGVRGEVDRNVFYGGEDEWTMFLLTGCDPRGLSVLGPQGRCTSMK